MADARIRSLHGIFEGDIFSGEVNDRDSGTFICLALRVSADAIDARDICRRLGVTFDRATGEATIHVDVPWNRTFRYRITSTAPLPAEVHDAFVNYDRRQFRGGREPTDDEMKLTEAEKKALYFIYDHEIANRLPD